MPRGPRPVPLALTSADREALERWTRRRTTAQALALRARIVLACAEPGATNSGVARARQVSRPTAMTWRRRGSPRAALTACSTSSTSRAPGRRARSPTRMSSG